MEFGDAPTPVEAAQRDAGNKLLSQQQELVDRISRLPLQAITIDQLADYCHRENLEEIFILDQKVDGIESVGTRESFGYTFDDGGVKITVIDHHVSDPELSEQSTGTLVIDYLSKNPVPDKDIPIFVTHKDCDSVLSALMLVGGLPPDNTYGEAVLSADHTARENDIADLLQSIEDTPKSGERVSDGSLAHSIRSLGQLLAGEPLDAEAQRLWDLRREARSSWERRADEFVVFENGTHLYVFDGTVTADPCPEFIVANRPDAKLILVFHNDPGDPYFFQVRAVRGLAADDLVRVDDTSLIPPQIEGFGGRKQAGSNRRSGISFKGDPFTAAKRIDDRLGEILADTD